MESKFGKKRKSISSSKNSSNNSNINNNDNSNKNTTTSTTPLSFIKTRSQTLAFNNSNRNREEEEEEEEEQEEELQQSNIKDKHPKKRLKINKSSEELQNTPSQPLFTALSTRFRRNSSNNNNNNIQNPPPLQQQQQQQPLYKTRRATTMSKKSSPLTQSQSPDDEDIQMVDTPPPIPSNSNNNNTSTSNSPSSTSTSSTSSNESNNNDRNTLQGLMKNLSGQLLDELNGGVNSTTGLRTSGLINPNTATGLINTLIEGRSRVKILLTGLKSDDENKQMESILELCDLLSIATEDTIAGFPSDSFAPALVNLLSMDHNPDMMLLAGRAISNMIEALPSSVNSVINHGAVPMLCSKLLSIEYIDLAEQSLQTLEKISLEHPTAVLRAGGLVAVLSYLDFFSTGVQRTAVSTAANICRGIPQDCFDMVKESIPNLSNLLQYSDQKIVELTCLCFSRLVDSFHDSQQKLEVITSDGLIINLVRILSGMYNSAISTLSPGTYSQIIRIMANIAHTCPHLVMVLLNEGISLVIQNIMYPSSDGSANTANSSVNRTNQQCYEILSLINELLPPLPSEYAYLLNPLRIGSIPPITPTIATGSRIPRPILSSSNTTTTTTTTTTTKPEPTEDPRTVIYRENPEYLVTLGKGLFVVLVEMFTSTLNPPVRYKCLGSICKILYFSTPDMVKDLLKDFAFSSFLASLLGSRDMTIVATALKMSELMMDKLPSIFDRYFKREGVLYEIDRISRFDTNVDTSPNNNNTTVVPSSGGIGGSLLAYSLANSNTNNNTPPTVTTPGSTSPNKSSSSVTNSPSTPISIPTTPSKSIPPPLASSPFGVGNVNFFGSPGGPIIPSTPTSHIHPPPSQQSTPTKEPTGVIPTSLPIVDELKLRVSKEAKRFKEKFFPKQLLEQMVSDESFSTSELLKLKDLSMKLNSRRNETGMDILVEIRNMLITQEGISAFEFLHSDLVPTILSYLTSGNIKLHAECFAKVFLDTAPRQGSVSLTSSLKLSSPNPLLLSLLIEKLHDALNKVERFNISISDVSGTSAGLKYLAQAFKLKLLRDGTDETLKDFSNNVVLIEPLATVAAIEEYIASKIVTLPKPTTTTTVDNSLPSSPPSINKSTNSTTPPTTTTTEEKKDELMDYEDDDEEFYEDDELLQGSDQIENEAETVHDVKLNESLSSSGTIPTVSTTTTTTSTNNNNNNNNLSTSQSTTPQPSSPTTKKLALFVDGQRLPSNLTIFQAVQKIAKSTLHPLNGITSSNNNNTEMNEAFNINIPTNRLWDSTHTIKYRYLTQTELETPQQQTDNSNNKTHIKPIGSSRLLHFLESEYPFSISTNDTTYEILSLLRVLDQFNHDPPQTGGDVKMSNLYNNNSIIEAKGLINPVELISQKLTAKIMRQLQDPLSLCGNAIPDWCRQLLTNCPFLFPFDCKRLFFYSTSFGIARALLTLQQRQDLIRQSSISSSSLASTQLQGDPNRVGGEVRVGRIQRQKVRIARPKILESAIKVMELYGKSKSMLEVEYFGEVGTGLGPTLEFFTLVSKEIQKKDLNLWYIDSASIKSNAEANENIYVYTIGGLFPKPVKPSQICKKTLDYFRFIGSFIAKTFFDQRLIDLPLSKAFFKYMVDQDLDFDDLKQLAPDYARSLSSLYSLVVKYNELKKNQKDISESDWKLEISKITIDGAKVEDLALDFELPGHPDWELKENGSNIPVTLENLEEYLNLIVKTFLQTGVKAQFDAFKEGFNQVFQISSLQLFSIHEIESLLCGSLTGSDADWSIDSLMDSTKADHGYTSSSNSVQNLFQIMSEFNIEERKQFLLFISGSPHLPIQGFKGLLPRLTIVKKHHYPPLTADDYLLSVMSCTNYIKLPDYSSKDVMKLKLLYAMKEGQSSFHLS